LAALGFDGVCAVLYALSRAFAAGRQAFVVIVSAARRRASAFTVLVLVISGRWAAVHVSFSSSPAAARRELGFFVIVAGLSWGHGCCFSMSFAFVAFVAVTLLAESAFVLTVLALEVVRAGTEKRGLVGELRVEVCFAVAAAFALDGTA
jgi:hypothetical protein